MRRRRRATPSGQALNDIRWATRVLVGPSARLAAEGDRAAELLRAQDPAAVWHFWEWNRVRLLATHRARGVNLATDLWDDHAGALADFARERAVQQELAALKVTRILARDGIRSLVLKGPGLAKRLYGDAALRDPSGDVDVLVAAGNLPRASALLQEHGWTQTLEALTQGDLPELHFALLGPDGMPHVELHWRMQWYERFAHTSELLQRAAEIDGIPRAAPEDLPHLMLLFWLRDGFHGLRLAADYAAAIEVADGEHPERPTTPSVQRALQTGRAAADAVFEGEHITAAGRAAGRRARMAQRIALTDACRTQRQAYSQAALVDLLAAEMPHRRRALATRWFRDPRHFAIEHEALPRPLHGPARAISFGRTVASSARLLSARTPRPSGG